MALIKCPECKKKVSDQCENCPNCGYPIKANIAKANIPEPEAAVTNDVVQREEKRLKKVKKPINKKILIAIIAVASVFLIVGGIIGYNALLPRINATNEFEVAVASVEEKNMQLDAAIKQSEDLILEKQPLLDESLIPALEAAISDTKAAKESNFKTPGSVEEIIARTEELKKIDYTSVLKILSEKHESVVINAKRYQLVNNPTEAYIIQCLQTIPEIVNISAVTEDNDPNGQLNKPGGYTATVYFAHEKINLDKSIYGETLIDQGTDAGGGIEVYTCVEDAIKRRDYLATFDGGIFANGTHTVIGTVLVRTSNELTATQQKDLEAKLIAALTYLPEIDKINPEPSEPDDTVSTPTTSPDAPLHTTQHTSDDAVSDENSKTISFQTLVSRYSGKWYLDGYANVYLHIYEDNDGWLQIYTNNFFLPDIYYGRDDGVVYPFLSGATTEEYCAGITIPPVYDWKEHTVQCRLVFEDSCIYAGSYKFVRTPGTTEKKFCLSHHMDVATCKIPSTCIYCGYTEGNPVECQYINGVCHFCGAENSNSQRQLAIEAAKVFRQNNQERILSVYELYDHLSSLGYSDAVCEDVSFYNTPEGFDDGSAMYDYERIIKFSNQGYSRDAIVNYYLDMFSYEDATYLVDECLAGRKLTYEYIDGTLVLVEH